MRWKMPIFNTLRKRCGFLLLPLTIEGETRWLEFAFWAERWRGKNGWEVAYWEDEPDR